MLYTGAMVSRSYQIDGLLDALSDKGATIVRTRLLVNRLGNVGLISEPIRQELLESLETEASQVLYSTESER